MKKPEMPISRKKQNEGAMPITVGVGASEGGLEAFQELLSALGASPGFAVIYVQHPASNSNSPLAEPLNLATAMKVIEISGRRILKPNCIYVAPAGQYVEIKHGAIRSVPPDINESPRSAIDHFFHSLAEDQAEFAVGIVLSGVGSDGTVGLKAISDLGGLTFSQDSTSAKFDSMPRSAATTGAADHVCRPSEIAQELLRYATHVKECGGAEVVDRIQKQIGEAIPRISEHLLSVTGHNFQHYKISMLTRRIQRRLQILKIATARHYLNYLQDNEEESNALFREMLIGVTAFFRDPEVFNALATTVLPTIFDAKSPNHVVRIWVAGCSTGEEAYTMAMLCLEHAETLESPPDFQIFASDIDERALQIARAGTYPSGIEDHISAERLSRFFFKRGKGYQVTKEIRKYVQFSKHNLISDPPFSRLDLISCRNLLIYLGAHLQKKLIPLFHYALRPSGFLLLGPSETISSHGELFKALDNKFRILQRKSTATGTIATLVIRQGEVKTSGTQANQPDAFVDLSSIRQRILLDEFAPKAAVVDQSGQVLNTSDGISKYLEVTGGDFHNNIIKMARPGLRIGLRAALNEAAKERRQVTHENLSIRHEGAIQPVMLTVQPMPQLGESDELFLVVFQDVGQALRQQRFDNANASEPIGEQAADIIIAQMERELESARNDVERTLQDIEAANEELKSSNEELLSMNEELQSANEELDTSKEEIQTALARIAQSDADQRNLLDSTNIATLFLDQDHHIRSFTPGVTAIYNLIPTDIGRPLHHTTHTAIEMPAYPTEISGTPAWPVEDEVETLGGRWFMRRIQPYMDSDDQGDGFVVTFYEISELKKLQMRLAAAHAVTKLLAEADSFETVIPEVLKSLRSALEAEVCVLWQADEGEQWLTCIEIDADDSSRQSFVDCSRELRFAVGEGLPGLVWERRQPVWFSEIQNKQGFARSQVAANCDLFSGVGTPIIVGNKFKGVIEIYTARQLTREPELLQLLGSVGNEIGQFIRQRRLDDRFRDQEARKTAILRSALDCIITMDIEGQIVDFNPSAERTFGYSASEVIGKSLADTIIPEEHRDAHRRGLERFLNSGESKVLGQRIELTSQRADGSRFPIELAINVSHGRGGAAFFTAYLRDITERKQAEAALIDAKLRMDLSLEVADVAPWNWDMQSKDVEPNPILNRMFGFDEAARPKLTEFISRIDPSAQERISQAIENSMETGATYDEEYSIRCPNGELRYVRARGQVRLSADRQVTDFFGVVVDITERKRREVEVADREAYLRLVIDTTLSFIAVLEPNGTVQEVNATAALATGSSREEMIGMKFWELLCWQQDTSLPAQLQDLIGKAAKGAPQRTDLPFFDSDQRVRTVDFSLNPVFDCKGNVTHLVQSGVDISERKTLERQQRVNSRRMEMALRAGGMAAWEWTPSLSFWSPELYALLGIDNQQEANPDLIFSLVHPEDAESLRSSWERAIDGSDVYDSEFRIIRPDGQIRWLKGLGEVVRNRSGKVERMYGVNWDATQHHLQAEALRESERRANEASASKSEFLANMSHEIRTPMTAILGYAELLGDLVNHAEAKQYLQTIRHNGDYLLEIINDILDLSKIEAGKLEVENEPFEPRRVIQDVLSIMEVRAREGGLTLTVEYDGKLPLVMQSDAKRLKQILINLVGNAIKFTRQGRVTIRVRFDAPSRQLQIDVIDTGIGISAVQIERLFKPFSQGDASVSRNFGGTGLGLAISQRLAETLGGSITASSVAGVGSTFSVRIAAGEAAEKNLVALADGATDQAEKLTDVREKIELRCHVLVVDDRRDIRYLSNYILTKSGASVVECEDGQLAVDHVSQCLKLGKCPDLILLDMQMPKLDGYATARQLRSLGYTGPIIALTADAMQGDMNRCIECGCNDYLSKPIDADKLVRLTAAFTSKG